MSRKLKNVAAAAAVLMVVSSLAVGSTGHPVAAAPTTLTVNITGLTEITSIEDGIFDGDCYGDFEYRITIGGTSITRPEFSLDPDFGVGCIIAYPFVYPEGIAGFSASATVDDADVGVLVTIEVVDIDTFDEDILDISPDPAAKVLRLSVDPITGQYTLIDAAGAPILDPSGAPTISPGEYSGTGGDAGGITLNIVSGTPDADGDGIPDARETAGTDWDGSGTIGDVPGEITNPQRADLFLELDLPTGPAGNTIQWDREEILAMKAAFARAPRLNPDGSFGITLWVDTGSLVDPLAPEGAPTGTCFDGIDQFGAAIFDGGDSDCFFLEGSVEDAPASCADGIDNNGDGLTDANDPTCLVGDNLGGGGLTGTAVSTCNLAAAFYTAKNADSDGDGVPEDLNGDGTVDNLFDVSRRPWFRYGMSVPSPASCTSGGQAEIGGNDFVDHNGDPGTLMHEFGHTLGLRHGGFENLNCKPNHVSVMSYTQQFGINRVGGGFVLDFAPVGIDLTNPLSRSAVFGSVLDENDLDETVAVTPTDPVNRFVFSDGNLAPVDLDGDGTNDGSWGALVTQNLDAPPDWDGNTATNDPSAVVDISRAGRISGTAWPTDCQGASPGQTLRSVNEWAIIQVPFRVNGDAANSALNPSLDDEPTIEELVGITTGLRTTDLSVDITPDPSTVVAGTSADLDVVVVNEGPNPADAIDVAVTVPPQLTVSTMPTECSSTDTGASCRLSSLLAGDEWSLTIGVDVAADAAFPTRTSAGVSASVTHLGDDPDADDDAAGATIDFVAQADLRVSDATVEGEPLGLVGEPVTFEVATVAANFGPSSPMDATVNVSAAHAFATLVPADQDVAVTALDVGSPQPVSSSVEATCTDAGAGDLSVVAAIAPTSPDDSDPDDSNNVTEASGSLECLLPAAINIRPGQFQNSVNAGEGSVELALLTTAPGEYGLPLGFDASWVDAASLRFGTREAVLAGDGAAEAGSARFVDARERSDEKSRDGDDDLRTTFRADASGLTVGDTEACIVGSFERPDGTGGRFIACDSVIVRPHP